MPGGFTSKPDRPCPDCLFRDALDMLGRPRYNRERGVSLALGCDGCGGTGRVLRESSGDPMWRGVW